MKISKLIIELAKQLAMHGDIEVYCRVSDYEGEDVPVTPELIKFNKANSWINQNKPYLQFED